jgi:hypothetical protein
MAYATNPKFGKVKYFRWDGLTGIKVFCPTPRALLA